MYVYNVVVVVECPPPLLYPTGSTLSLSRFYPSGIFVYKHIYKLNRSYIEYHQMDILFKKKEYINPGLFYQSCVKKSKQLTCVMCNI